MRDVFIEMPDMCQGRVMLKYEGFNAAGSIKMKSALSIIDQMEASGELKPGCEIIESSSGNLGVALSIICAARGYKFTCVTDPASTENARYAIRATGANLIIVEERDENGGYLMTRLKTIAEMCEQNPNLIWTNQYANQANCFAHYSATGPEILEAFPEVDWLFIGAGTTGTLMGCTRFFKEHSPNTKIVAVDTEGSITFGGDTGKRYIPGLGTSRVPPICDHDEVEQVQMIAEIMTVKECRYWASKGYMFGGSTGTVLAAIREYADQIGADDTVVCISPDGGEKYLNTIYNPNWVEKNLTNLTRTPQRKFNR
ncbi:2,3-diaminopropionate biosynthesis protein SbnA [Pseudoalteromonas luteoviolacea]|nr:2,3-diaminopropionate biosynthesis protein SbnA [Pseudoalteromonas luteoviolacea]